MNYNTANFRPETRLACAVIIQALKDRDWLWLLSEESSDWWVMAGFEQPTSIPKNLRLPRITSMRISKEKGLIDET